MRGSKGHHLLKTKAATSKVLLKWMIDLLGPQGCSRVLDDSGDHGGEGAKLMECCGTINEFYEILARERR
eukprot:9024625-Pyramimonas_sp.AAC.1